MTPLRYLWAFVPNTLLGLLFVPPTLLTGGRARVERGCLELHGGFTAAFLKRGIGFGPAAAMCLGHVILGRDRSCLEASRDHEHVHVRQYERWGPLMLPAYFLCSLFAWRRGEHPYLGNRFEREAFDQFP